MAFFKIQNLNFKADEMNYANIIMIFIVEYFKIVTIKILICDINLKFVLTYEIEGGDCASIK